tara:strand:+ start:1196 stop:1486 length:291 start_codon:yes stop_codon:yes gene_type:complete
MLSRPRQHQLLYLLTALVLLMQSFAVWHDAEHPFHSETEQCERFEAFGHSPTLDHIVTSTFIFTALFNVVETFQPNTFLPSSQRDAYAIRAPPLFS